MEKQMLNLAAVFIVAVIWLAYSKGGQKPNWLGGWVMIVAYTTACFAIVWLVGETVLPVNPVSVLMEENSAFQNFINGFSAGFDQQYNS